MADHSRIEWTDATWNPITGCTLVSEGCRSCYAAEIAAGRLRHHPSRKGLARRNADGVAAFTGEVRLNEDWLDQPFRWRRPRRIFVCAHGDLFHEAVPDDWILMIFEMMRNAFWHNFQVLTKRPERMRELLIRMGEGRIFPLWLAPWPLPNVWLGVSAEDQATADARIPPLLETPAAVRFLSAEPLLGPIDLWQIRFRNRHGGEENWNVLDEDPHCPRCGAPAGGRCDCAQPQTIVTSPTIDWVIAGGESGRNARPMHPDWARKLRDQCQAAGVPFFFKQWGEWAPAPDKPNDTYEAFRARDARDSFFWKRGGVSELVGKTRAGRILDGREWSEMPA